MKLLIVENSFRVRQIIRSVVAPLAAEIEECADGGDAVALFSSGRPDFVLMDINLDAMDGITATRRIRALNPAARVIIVTSYDQEDLREEAEKAGACGYVLKDDLLALVDFIR